MHWDIVNVCIGNKNQLHKDDSRMEWRRMMSSIENEYLNERQNSFLSIYSYLHWMRQPNQIQRLYGRGWLHGKQLINHRSKVKRSTKKKVRKKTDRPFILDSRWFRHIGDIIDTRTIEDDRSRSRCRHKEKLFYGFNDDDDGEARETWPSIHIRTGDTLFIQYRSILVKFHIFVLVLPIENLLVFNQIFYRFITILLIIIIMSLYQNQFNWNELNGINASFDKGWIIIHIRIRNSVPPEGEKKLLCWNGTLHWTIILCRFVSIHLYIYV